MAEGQAERSSAHSKDVGTFKISGWRERAHRWEVTNRKQLGVGVGDCPSAGPTGHDKAWQKIQGGFGLGGVLVRAQIWISLLNHPYTLPFP